MFRGDATIGVLRIICGSRLTRKSGENPARLPWLDGRLMKCDFAISFVLSLLQALELNAQLKHRRTMRV